MGGGVEGGSGWGVSFGGSEQRIGVFVKIQKKIGGSRGDRVGGSVLVDLNKELKFL